LNIVFYSHRVSYPNCLSAQVLPRELKDLAIKRLEEIKLRVPDFENVKKHPILKQITLQQIQDNINYMNSKDQSHMFNDFIEFNLQLDKSRGQSLFDVMPELLEFRSHVD
jgi:hypothetical protein